MTDNAPKLFTVMPVRNEVDRYLHAALYHATVISDGVLVYDDNSTDESARIAADVLYRFEFEIDWAVVNNDNGPLMLEDEAAFRQSMIEGCVEKFRPRSGIDWILVNDADEFVCVPNGMVRRLLQRAMDDLAPSTANVLVFGRDELWSIDPPLVRVDGFWAGLKNHRMFRYQEGPQTMKPQKLACGSVPLYANNEATVSSVVRVLHAGYVNVQDRIEKHDRYAGRPEHSAEHIASILDRNPALKPLAYGLPPIWRGVVLS